MWRQGPPPPKRQGRLKRSGLVRIVCLALVAYVLAARGFHLRSRGPPPAAAATAAGGDRLLRVFVADLPPKYNVDVLWARRDGPACATRAAAAALLANPTGEAVPGAGVEGLRRTEYFGLQVYLHQQLLRSPLRVARAADADVVFVPLYDVPYGGALGPCSPARPRWGNASNLAAEFLAEAEALLPALGRLPHWLPLAQLSLDHMYGCGGWGDALLCHPLMRHFVFTAAEVVTTGFVFKSAPWARLRRARFEDLPDERAPRPAGAPPPEFVSVFGNREQAHPNAVAVPYFGHVHAPQGAAAEAAARAPRKHLAAAALGGAARRLWHGAPLRPRVLADCAAHPGCLSVAVRSSAPSQLDFSLFDAYRAAWFCPQPYGDTPTRLGIYDCAALGTTLPVVFDDQARHLLAFADVVDYGAWMVTLNMSDALAAANMFEELDRRVPPPERRARLAALRRVAHVMQYAVEPDHRLVTFEGMREVHARDDAFTSSCKAVMRNLCGHGLLDAALCGRGAGAGRFAAARLA